MWKKCKISPLKHLDAQVAEGVAPVFGMRRSLVCAVPTCGESPDIVHESRQSVRGAAAQSGCLTFRDVPGSCAQTFDAQGRAPDFSLISETFCGSRSFPAAGIGRFVPGHEAPDEAGGSPPGAWVRDPPSPRCEGVAKERPGTQPRSERQPRI